PSTRRTAAGACHRPQGRDVMDEIIRGAGTFIHELQRPSWKRPMRVRSATETPHAREGRRQGRQAVPSRPSTPERPLLSEGGGRARLGDPESPGADLPAGYGPLRYARDRPRLLPGADDRARASGHHDRAAASLYGRAHADARNPAIADAV